jgi:hypothetical protein
MQRSEQDTKYVSNYLWIYFLSLTNPPVWLVLRRYTIEMEEMTLFLLKRNSDKHIVSFLKALEYSIATLYNVKCTVQFANQ